MKSGTIELKTDVLTNEDGEEMDDPVSGEYKVQQSKVHKKPMSALRKDR